MILAHFPHLQSLSSEDFELDMKMIFRKIDICFRCFFLNLSHVWEVNY